MISYISEYKYYAIFTIVAILSGYILKNIKGSEEKVEKEEIPNIKEIELEKIIKSFENAIKKSTQTVIKFNENSATKTNYLNMRNELFTKDIMKKKLLIDSSMKINDSNNNNNYSVSLSDTADTFKNVIGFRLIECAIPITSHTINNNNNKLNITSASGAHTVTFDTGEFTPNEIAAKMNSSDLTTYDGTFNCTFNSETNRFTITRSADLLFKFKSTGNSCYKLLGYDKIDEIEKNQPIHDVHHGYNYFDIVVDNIPNIACKMNTMGLNVIDRIIVNTDMGYLLTYRVPESETQTSNYFYPISMNNISIKIYTADGEIYDNTAGQNLFEFEVTTLINTKLMN